MTDPSIRKLQLAELEIFKHVINICEKYNLTYYLMGGTLLGAVRHKGFIPWDDDMDIGIPRPDYDKFLEAAEKELPEFLKVQSFYKDKDFGYYVPKIINPEVKLRDKSSMQEKEQFAWIDIFPLDGMPKNNLKRKIHSYRLLFARLLLKYSQFSTIVAVNLPHRPLHEKILINLGKVIPFEKMLNTRKALFRLDKLLKKYSYEKSDYLVNFMGAYKLREMFHKDHYGNGALYDFEEIKANGPADYDFVLKQMYGDYMTPPPTDERNKHFTEVIE